MKNLGPTSMRTRPSSKAEDQGDEAEKGAHQNAEADGDKTAADDWSFCTGDIPAANMASLVRGEKAHVILLYVRCCRASLPPRQSK